MEEGGFLYDSDAYNDDLPYFVEVGGKRHLIVPYTPDANDFCFWTAPGFITAEHFHQYLRDSFDTLYAESATTPKMMSIGLHARMIGRPGRIAGSPASSNTRKRTRASGSQRAKKSPTTGSKRRVNKGQPRRLVTGNFCCFRDGCLRK